MDPLNSSWSREAIIEAMRTEFERTGLPPSTERWNAATPEHPHASTVRRVFGSWGAALEAAELPRNKTGGLYWTHRRIIAAIQRWAQEHGAPPTYDGWEKAGPYNPPSRTVAQAFGSWSKALWEAGYFARTSHGHVRKGEPIPARSGRAF